jgi:hypothetical protein
MAKKSDATARKKPMTLRIEGTMAVARLQELLRMDPELTLQIVAPRRGPSPRSARLR